MFYCQNMLVIIWAFSSVIQSCLILCHPHGLARQTSLFITNSWSLLKLMSIESVMPSNHLILSWPFSSCLQFFSTFIGCFPVSQFFTSAGQSIGASALVPPMNIQGWLPLRLTGLISLLSKGLSRVFFSTTDWYIYNIWFNVSFKASVFLLFCLDDLGIDINGVL